MPFLIKTVTGNRSRCGKIVKPVIIKAGSTKPSTLTGSLLSGFFVYYMPYEILLIEDDSNDVLLIERAFNQVSLQINLKVVSDGDSAVAYLEGSGRYCDRKQNPLPSLILLDLKLPRRSGLEVLSWLRQQPVLRRIPVVVLTSSRENSDVDQAYEIGVNSYLQKPVSYDSLNQLVSALDIYWLKLNQFPSVSPP